MQAPTAFIIVHLCKWNKFSIEEKNENMKDVSVILQIFILLIRVEEKVFPYT